MQHHKLEISTGYTEEGTHVDMRGKSPALDAIFNVTPVPALPRTLLIWAAVGGCQQEHLIFLACT